MVFAKKLRTLQQIRADSCSKDLARRAEEYFQTVARYQGWRDTLRTPSLRRGVVEKFFGKPLEEMTGDERAEAEAVCVVHDQAAVDRFASVTLEALFSRLPAASLQLEFNQRYCEELEKEIPVYADYLRPAFVAMGVEPELEASLVSRFGEIIAQPAPPLRVLHDALARAREAVQRGGGDAHAMQSTFRGLCPSIPS